MPRKVIGIVGGMGSEAGIALYQSVLAHTHAGSDQEHLSTILMSFPELISDRTAFLVGETKINPAYEVVNVIERLATSGAEVIGIACNTSHVAEIFDVITEGVEELALPVELLNMPEEVGCHLKNQLPSGSRVGVLMTNGTYHSGMYEDVICKSGFTPVVPDEDFQKEVIHPMIYDPINGIKANYGVLKPGTRRLFEQAMDHFIQERCDAVILGCTELSLTGELHNKYPIRFIDSTDCLAQSLVQKATEHQEEALLDPTLIKFD
jgi:aspartate racemase